MGSPLVSVVVLAYNKLDYTKQCIESFYRHTSHIDFELITINNGSSRYTKRFFDSLPNQKKIDFTENQGVDKAINHGIRMAEGEFTINVSNDLVLTKNWLDNLLTCAKSDSKIGMVAPMCSASSNNQQIDLGYDDLDEMQDKAAEFNVSDPRKWEDRLRLVTYSCLFRTDVLQRLGGFDEDFNPGAYDDDAISFSIRRRGYRLIAARDTFIHHYGSVTFAAEYAKNDLAKRNRSLFHHKFGVDSWAASRVDFEMLSTADVGVAAPGQRVDILGVGQSCGATLLQLANMLRAAGIFDVGLWYISQSPTNLVDLKTICQGVESAESPSLASHFPGKRFDYVIVESDSQAIRDLPAFYGGLFDRLRVGGQMLFTAPNSALLLSIFQALGPERLSRFRHATHHYHSWIKSA